MQDQYTVDVERIASQRKAQWMKAARAKRFDLMRAIDHSVPYWLIIIALVMFVLSAPHTASVFDQLTPGWGWSAPLGVEFGLLYAAFRRKRARIKREKTPASLWLLEGLLFITAVVVNGAGSLQAAVSASKISAMSLVSIVEQFGAMSVTVQIGLILVPLAAFIIPIGTGVTGEGLASLILEWRAADDGLEDTWREVIKTELYQALFAELTRRGVSAVDARREASALSAGYVGGRVADVSPRLSGPVRADTSQVSALVVSEPVRTAPADVPDKRTLVVQWLSDHPDEALSISVRKLAEAVGVSKTLAHEVLNEYRQRNGAS